MVITMDNGIKIDVESGKIFFPLVVSPMTRQMFPGVPNYKEVARENISKKLLDEIDVLLNKVRG